MPNSSNANSNPHYTICLILYDQFDLLEVAAPLSLFSMFPDNFRIVTVSEHGRPVASQQGNKLSADDSLYTLEDFDVLIVPGGDGIKKAVESDNLVNWIKKQYQPSRYICAFCTGAALLAEAGILRHRSATTNKQQYRWVTGFGENIDWFPVARWVRDGHIFTSSGKSAAMDLSLALIATLLNEESARKAAINAEYIWVNDPGEDPFAPLHIVQ
ncbi:DJ-1/PfpI family protein [Photobacterium sanctipauli]|uniref:DJ-1/PfpI family protein n=1 Tax=Photobacterium sanctipauli TaxID=1342794 RepID=A0A2T3NV78_9GAMM|nr:DJ-1/PfpI family protein [Photobacterium sanctipauli]PSW20152.1 DJ-1/PfpI family protein [Photobacterium sanctipauli]